MTSNNNTKKAILLAYDCFELTHPENTISEKQLTELLGNYLNQRIDQNLNDVLNILYRIDVNENKVKQALSNTTDKTAGEVLAELIIERQKLKLYYRKKFSS